MADEVPQGFRVPTRTARLRFEGFEGFEGCEVLVSLDISWEDYFYFDELKDRADTPARESLEKFGNSFLDSWNLVDAQGQPLPANAEGLFRLPPWFTIMLLDKWKEAMEVAAGVYGPLGRPSPNGKRAAARSRRKSSMPAS